MINLHFETAMAYVACWENRAEYESSDIMKFIVDQDKADCDNARKSSKRSDAEAVPRLPGARRHYFVVHKLKELQKLAPSVSKPLDCAQQAALTTLFESLYKVTDLLQDEVNPGHPTDAVPAAIVMHSLAQSSILARRALLRLQA